jgi:glucose/mannose transport system permease protein
MAELVARGTASPQGSGSGVAPEPGGGAVANRPRPAAGVAACRGRAGHPTVPLLSLLPVWAIVVLVYIGTTLWTAQISLTDSRLLPTGRLVGFSQYVRLFDTPTWRIALINLMILGVLVVGGCLAFGTLLAMALDRAVRFENSLRTIFLYPYAMSLVVTGLVWQWLMNPGFGIEATAHQLGWTWFAFDWTQHRETAIYGVALAGIWQGSGLVMVLMLAGLRGVDPDIWKATRIEGIPVSRTYRSIVLPQLAPTVATAVILLAMGVIKTFDLVVAMTNGGPGTSTVVPAKFILDNLFGRQNLGLATAGATVMLITVLAVVVPIAYARSIRATRLGNAL